MTEIELKIREISLERSKLIAELESCKEQELKTEIFFEESEAKFHSINA